ncbi:MAG TPA: leucine-rich repeat domain-containing protein [Kineosporiaceae bacterium]|nr:leucine-rich repeat domain-containing protein [Kineosporiaceae bacterium]
MRQTRPVAVFLVVTAVPVAAVMHNAGSGPAVILLMLALSSAPLIGLRMARRAGEISVTAVRTGVSAVVLLSLGFVITQLVLAVTSLERGGSLRADPLAAAAIVALAALYLMLLVAAGTATVPVLRPVEVGQWIRDHGGSAPGWVAAAVIVVGLVLVGFATSGSSRLDSGRHDSGWAANGFGSTNDPIAPPTIDPAVIHSMISQAFPDPVLRACVNASSSTIGVSMQGLAGLTELSCLGSDNPDQQVHSLEGLQHLTNLITLELSGNAVQELSPLSGLLRLQKLDLSDNRITKVTPLSGALALDRLTLSDNRISDPRPLQSLPELTMLNIAGNRITDASRLIRCPKVDELWIGSNPLTDVAPLLLMPSLLGVDLAGLDQARVTGVEKLQDKGVYVGGMASGRG